MCARVGTRDQTGDIDPRCRWEHGVVPREADALLGETQQMRRGVRCHHIGPQAIQTDNHNMRGLHRSPLNFTQA